MFTSFTTPASAMPYDLDFSRNGFRRSIGIGKIVVVFLSVAISASVSDGVVTLTGNVPNAALSRRADRVARETPGVSSVTNRVQVAA